MPEPDAHARPWRSVLYLPASNAKALEKARALSSQEESRLRFQTFVGDGTAYTP